MIRAGTKDEERGTRGTSPGDARTTRLWLTLATSLALILIQSMSAPLAWTGDEPRYTYYAAAFSRTLGLSMSDAEWASFQHESGVAPLSRVEIMVARPTPVHGPLHAILIAPAVGIAGLQGGRWAQLAIAAVGIAFMLRLLVPTVPTAAAAIATAFVFLSLPVQPYARLLYSDIWLLAAVVIAWFGIRRELPSAATMAFALIPIFLLPFLHLRMASVAAGLFAAWMWRLATEPAIREVRLRLMTISVAGGVLAAILFATYQLSLFGHILGGATAPEPFSLSRLLYRFGVQLLEVRHGLLANNPALLLSFVGLAAAFRRHQLARQAVLLLVLSLPFVFGASSEAMPGRFWVGIMPPLIAGLALWLAQARSVLAWVAAAPLIVVSLATSVLLVIWPNAFLENRQVSFTYEYLHDRLLHAGYFAPFLPWETFALPVGAEALNQHVTYVVLAIAGVLGLTLTLGLTATSRGARGAWNAISLAIIGAIAWWCSATPMAPGAVTTQTNVRADGRHELLITFATPQSPRVLTFGEPRLLWFPPHYPDSLTLEALAEGDGATWRILETVPTRPILGVRDRERVRAIRVVEGNATQGTWTQSPLTVLR